MSFTPDGDVVAADSGVSFRPSGRGPSAIGERLTSVALDGESPARQLDGHTPSYDPAGRYLAVQRTEMAASDTSEGFVSHSSRRRRVTC